MLSVGTVVMGVENLERAISFWTQALGHAPKREVGPTDDFTILVPASGQGTHIALDVSESPVQPHQRVHLDLIDVPAALSTRTRLLGSGRAQKNDPNDARSVAITAMRVDGLQRVSADEHAQVLKLLAKRHRDLGQLKSNSTTRSTSRRSPSFATRAPAVSTTTAVAPRARTPKKRSGR